MSRARALPLLASLAGVAVTAAVLALVRGPARVASLPSARAVAADVPGGVAPIDGDVIDSLATVTSDHDPFRLTREPASVPYAPEAQGAPLPPPRPPAPPIVLSGVVGPPWVALLDGVPGHSGSALAKPGDTLSRAPFAVVVLQRVGRDTVTVRSGDSAWALTVRQAWQ